MKSSNIKWWGAWFGSSLLLAAYYAYAITNSGSEADFLPGESSHGHYQIELACNSCHGEAFDGPDVMQKACVSCHSAELERVEDSHPRKKFTDPRNADRLEQLDARYCVTCHSEHRTEITDEMGVTLPTDFCYLCHQDIEEDRESHKDFKFDSCANAGCHNYHDNKALYEDFLVKHGKEKRETLADGQLLSRDLAAFINTVSDAPHYIFQGALKRNDADMPQQVNVSGEVISSWLGSTHAENGVNCSHCHMSGEPADDTWIQHPEQVVCKQCHGKEYNGFMASRHGMRSASNIDLKLSAMSPALARLPMKEDSFEASLTCHSCHGSHNYDTEKAAVEACLGCHNDNHSIAYKKSPHFKLWQQEQQGLIPAGRGVSCSSCHLPRETIRDRGHDRTIVQHNQNDYLRPNEKMIRPVCLQCHSLGFTINSLADSALIETNFNGKPPETVASIEMALKREGQDKRK